MDELLNFSEIQITNTTFTDFIIGLFILLLLSFFLKKTYEKYSLSVSNKKNFSSILPLFAVGIFIIVVSIKSSIVLSLGLVGALSIIRMRTAIKEIEQIVYLLLLTAVSISIAANIYYYGVILSATVFIYSFYNYRRNLTNNDYQNDLMVLKFNLLDIPSLNEVISIIKNDNNLIIQSINSNKTETSITLKIDGISLELIEKINAQIQVNDKVQLLELNIFNSID